MTIGILSFTQTEIANAVKLSEACRQFGALRTGLVVRTGDIGSGRYWEMIGNGQSESRLVFRRFPAILHREQQAEAP